MEIYNKFSINNSPKNDKEYNQKYYDYNKKSSINNNGNIHEEKLNNKKNSFPRNSSKDSSFKNPILNKETKYNNDLSKNELNNQIKKAINLFFESKKTNLENSKNNIERNSRNNLKDKTNNENIPYMFTSNSEYNNIYEKESQDFLTKINQLSQEINHINHIKNKSTDFKNKATP